MIRMLWFLLVVIAISSGAAGAASLQKAQMLFEHGRLEDAKHALADVVTGDSSDEDKAGALYLLGTIAIEQKRYPIAARMWSDLIQRYPDSRQALEARSKLSTIPNGAQHSMVRVDAAEVTAEADPFEGVLVTATSIDSRYSGQMVSEIVRLLDSKGVRVTRAQAPSTGNRSVLLLSLEFGRRDTLQAVCRSSDGALLWSEKAAGFLRFDKAAITSGLIKQIKAQIETHVGDACLPVSSERRATPG